MRTYFLILIFIVVFWSLSSYFYNWPVLLSASGWLKITFSLSIAGLVVIFLEFKKSHKDGAAEYLRAVYLSTSFIIFITVAIFLYFLFPLIWGLKEYFWLGPAFTTIFLLIFIFGYSLVEKIGKEYKKRKEAEMLAMEREKLAQSKDQFVLSLQHHLRTPLTPFKMYLERILDGSYGRVDNPVIREKLLEMKKLANTLYSLIENLLEIQQLKINSKILNKEDCQIKNLIKSIVEELKPLAEEKGLYLKYEFPPQELPLVKIDKKRIKIAIWNLVDNAIKYTNRGGVIIKLEIKDQELKISVIDSGIGMEKEEINYFLQGKLFERGEEAKKLYGPGKGIGLAVAIEFIKAHGGQIWAESKGWGKGTTFCIKLPIKI